VAEGRVFPGGNHLAGSILAKAATDVLERNSLGEEVLEEHEVGGLWIHVIRPNEVKLFVAFIEKVVDRRDCLLVDGFGSVENVFRHFLPFVLNRIEE